jgi:hypothetical protein
MGDSFDNKFRVLPGKVNSSLHRLIYWAGKGGKVSGTDQGWVVGGEATSYQN